MINMLISSGQTGAANAARDVAYRLKIQHSSKESDAEDSDGTLLVSYVGVPLNGDQPSRHINLSETQKPDALKQLVDWITQHNIKVLTVTGSPFDDQELVYEKTFTLINNAIWVVRSRTGDIDPKPSENPDKDLKKDEAPPKTVDQAIERILRDMHLKDKTIIANMSFDELDTLHPTVGSYIRNEYDLWFENKELMKSCEFIGKEQPLDADAASMVIIEELWKRLRETHKLKVVKGRTGGKLMKELDTWAKKSKFAYEGSVKTGTLIRYGKDKKYRINVSKEKYAKLLKYFSSNTVDIGTSRDTAPAGSLGDWLQNNVTKTAIASYVGPILLNEGYAKKIGKSQIQFK